MRSKTAIFGCLLENKITNKQTNKRPNIYFEKSSEFFSKGWSAHQNSFRCSYWSIKKIFLKLYFHNGSGKICSVKSRNPEKRPWPIERAEKSKVQLKKPDPKCTGLLVFMTKTTPKTANFGISADNTITNKQTNKTPATYFIKCAECFCGGQKGSLSSLRRSHWSV